MAFSAALFYKMISFNTNGFLRKSRNMGISFIVMGYWFVPELFNPFLKKAPKTNIVV
jgi:fructose-specific phosphotransferase system IIC component